MPCPSLCPSLAVPRSVSPCYARKEFLFRKIFPLDRPNIWNGRIVDYRAPEVVDPKKKYGVWDSPLHGSPPFADQNFVWTQIPPEELAAVGSYSGIDVHTLPERAMQTRLAVSWMTALCCPMRHKVLSNKIAGQQEAASFEADSRCMKQTRGSGKFLQGEYKAREPRKPDCFEDYMYDTVDQSGRRYYRLRRADRILQDGAFCAQVKTV